MSFIDAAGKKNQATISPKYPEADKHTSSFAKALIIPFWLFKDTEGKGMANMKRAVHSSGPKVCTCRSISGHSDLDEYPLDSFGRGAFVFKPETRENS